ncbi:MAG: IclR family transcriptional regulator, partial [Paenibacillus sp.]|nr:IclR family transcriptional regulator [Paenibacillus sp.]
GYSFSRSELENYTAELSAPIFDYSGQIVAALSIAGLEVQFEEEKMPELINKVRYTANEISQKLGYIQSV